MKWFRSNIRVGSRLALLALAIQFLLSFDHFHGVSAQAASASLDATRLALHGTGSFTAAQCEALDRAWHANASAPAGLKTSSSGDVPAGQPGDDCAICAVMALGKAMVPASPPDLPTPQAIVLVHLALEPGFLILNSARPAFRPRAPPIS
jgi:hypothetical protein